MTETRTARLSLPNWGADTDSPSRADFDEAFNNLEQWTAIDLMDDVLANRPAPEVRGRYFRATDTNAVYRDTGTAWRLIGQYIEDAVVRPSAAGTVGLTIKGQFNQTANLFEIRDTLGIVLGYVTATGQFFAPSAKIGIASPANTAVVALGTTNPGASLITMKAGASPTVDLIQLQDSTGAVIFKVDKDANVQAAGYKLANGVALDTIEAFSFYSSGTMAVQTGKHEVPLPVGYQLVSVSARVSTAPSGAAILIDINYNGATVYTTQANRVTIADGQKNATVSAAQVTTFASGGYLSVDIDQVGSSTPGSDLVLLMRLRRTS